MDINRVELIGTLIDDPKVNANKDVNVSYSRFTISTAKKWKDPKGQSKESRERHNCIAFGKTGKLINDMLIKGMRVHLVGELKERTFKNDEMERSFVEVNISQFEILANANY